MFKMEKKISDYQIDIQAWLSITGLENLAPAQKYTSASGSRLNKSSSPAAKTASYFRQFCYSFDLNILLKYVYLLTLQSMLSAAF